MRLLLIEDDRTFSQSIQMILGHAGINVHSTALGKEGIDLAKRFDYDAVILDLDLPDINGRDVLRHLRGEKIRTPVLVLSGADSTETKVMALEFGADDYITKPIHQSELIARIRAIVRRSLGHVQSTIQTGEICLDLNLRIVVAGGVKVQLTEKEYQVFELLCLRKGTTVSKEMFLNHLYGGMDEPGVKIVDVFIAKLRKKIAAANNGKSHIITNWGVGYFLQD